MAASIAPVLAMEPIEVWTIGRVLRWTQQRFAARGLLSPRLDAELLLAHTLGRSRVALYTHFDQPLEKEELAGFRGLIQQRLAGKPVAYLIGEKEFFGLPLQVSEAVLIPRPETELLVESALELLPKPQSAAPSLPEPQEEAVVEHAEPGVELHVDYDAPNLDNESSSEPDPALATTVTDEPTTGAPVAATTTSEPVATLVDVGTGSGAVALAIAHRRKDVRVIAIDASAEALAVAAANGHKLGLSVEFLRGDLLAALPPGTRPDCIVANLPYIPTAEIDALSPEVRSEPRAALDGGPDGLVLVRRLVAQAATCLVAGGALALEIGDGQSSATCALLTAAGFVDVRSARDLAQIPRVVSGRRPR